MKYRKLPVVIEAVQFLNWKKDDNPFLFIGPPEWLLDAIKKKVITGGQGENSWSLYIKTLEGTMEVAPNDWIIQGVNGELYPCKPDIFEKTYEVAE